MHPYSETIVYSTDTYFSIRRENWQIMAQRTVVSFGALSVGERSHFFIALVHLLAFIYKRDYI